MKVTLKKKSPETLRLEKLRDGVSGASNLAYEWLNRRDLFDFTNSNGSQATADDVMKEMIGRIAVALTESHVSEGIGIMTAHSLAELTTQDK